jgi:hypothetical protein
MATGDMEMARLAAKERRGLERNGRRGAFRLATINWRTTQGPASRGNGGGQAGRSLRNDHLARQSSAPKVGRHTQKLAPKSLSASQVMQLQLVGARKFGATGVRKGSTFGAEVWAYNNFPL